MCLLAMPEYVGLKIRGEEKLQFLFVNFKVLISRTYLIFASNICLKQLFFISLLERGYKYRSVICGNIFVALFWLGVGSG